jgi:hypothetical protein
MLEVASITCIHYHNGFIIETSEVPGKYPKGRRIQPDLGYHVCDIAKKNFRTDQSRG